ncbi:MAG TPA: hypothetical protein VIK82_08490, partial [Porticoccaceae bacterium]
IARGLNGIRHGKRGCESEGKYTEKCGLHDCLLDPVYGYIRFIHDVSKLHAIIKNAYKSLVCVCSGLQDVAFWQRLPAQQKKSL